MTASRPCKKLVELRDSSTREVIKTFNTLEEAIEYADLNDLKCYIDMTPTLQ